MTVPDRPERETLEATIRKLREPLCDATFRARLLRQGLSTDEIAQYVEVVESERAEALATLAALAAAPDARLAEALEALNEAHYHDPRRDDCRLCAPLLAAAREGTRECGQQPCDRPATREVNTNYGVLGQLCDEHYSELESALAAREGTRSGGDAG